MSGIGERLDDLLRRRALSNRDVERLTTDKGQRVSHSTVGKIRRGDEGLSVQSVEALAEALEVEPSWLLFGEGEEKKAQGFSEGDARPWFPPPPNGQRPDQTITERGLTKMVAPRARQPTVLELTRDQWEFRICAGDLAVVDLSGDVEDGSLCYASVYDAEAGKDINLVRRIVRPYLVAEGEPLLVAGSNVSVVRGPLVAVVRAPDLIGTVRQPFNT
ncbi:MAG: hypothetical protein AAFR79_16085 [Pseudomonadota bacterium]